MQAAAVRLADPSEWRLAYPPHPITGRREPNKPQALAHACPADILFYGGVRGGGKTEFVGTQAAIHGFNHPDIQMLVVRRSREEMKSNVIPVLRRILPDHIAKWSRSDHAFLFRPPSKAVLIVDFMSKEEDIARYLGSEFGYVAIDQAEQLTEYTALGLFSCVRSTQPWPKQLHLTGNPGLGIGVAWLRRWFIKPRPEELGGRRAPLPGELWQPRPKPGNPTPPELMPTRCFIPARFEDNDALKAGDPMYKARIYLSFTATIARAQAEGDWEASDAYIVGAAWQDQKTIDEALVAKQPKLEGLVGRQIQWHVIQNPQWRPPVGALIYGSLDYGFGVPMSMHLHAALAGGKTRTFLERYGAGHRDEDQAKLLRQLLTEYFYADGKTPLMDGIQWVVFDPAMDASRKEHAIAKTIIEVYQDHLPTVQFRAGAGGRAARLSRPNRWLDALADGPDGFPNWSVTTACPDLIRTLPEIPRDPDDPDVEHEDSENHAYEDTGRFFEARPFAPRHVPPDPYAGLDALSRQHHQAQDAARKRGKPGLGGLAKR